MELVEDVWGVTPRWLVVLHAWGTSFFGESPPPKPKSVVFELIMPWPRLSLAHRVISFTNANFVYILLFLFCVNICINVSPSPSVMRSEPLVKHLQMGIMEIFQITFLGLCSFIFIFSQIDLNIRYISFNTRLNTLTISKKKCNKNLYPFLLLLLYLGTFEYFFVIFLPNEYLKINLDIRGITKIYFLLVKTCHNLFANITLGACYRCMYLICLSRVNFLTTYLKP